MLAINKVVKSPIVVGDKIEIRDTINLNWEIDEYTPIQFNRWSQFINLVESTYGS